MILNKPQSLKVIFGDNFLKLSVKLHYIWNCAHSLVVPGTQVRVVLLIQFSPCKIHDRADLAIVLYISNCDILAAEVLLSFELLVQARQ